MMMKRHHKRILTEQPRCSAGLVGELGKCDGLGAIFESLKDLEITPDLAHCELHWLQLVRSECAP